MKCRRCGTDKPEGEFYKKHRQCKTCCKKRARQRYAENKEMHPERLKAKNAVKAAVRAGRMKKAAENRCEHCGEQANDYHHHSYDKEHWLDVVPLCRSCHKKLHLEKKAEDAHLLRSDRDSKQPNLGQAI